MAAAAAADGGERGRSWYLSKEEIERGSPSRRDGVGAAKEAQLRATYCSFIRDVGLRLRLPQITIATGMLLCHRFYLHQSHAKNEWQTVATACIFLASKVEDTPCQLESVVIRCHETMYKKNPVAARRINQKVILEKQKALILAGEALLLSTIRYDLNIQHPYEPLNVALKKLGISHKEVKQSATNLINDTLRTTLVVQLKPHYIAAGSLSLAARFHNVRLPTENGKVWWQQFDIAPKLLEAAIQQMKELFMKRNQLPKSPAIQPTPAETPVEKQQIVSTTPAIQPTSAQPLVEKQQITSTTPAIQPTSAQPLVEKQQITSTTPAIRAIPAQTPVQKQPTISTSPAIRPIPAQTLMEEQQTIITAPAIRPIPDQDRAEKMQKRSMTPAIRPIPAQTPVEKQQTISKTPAIRSVPAQDPVEKQQTRSTTPAIRPIPAQTPVEKQQTRSKTPAIRYVPPQDPVEKQQIRSKTPAIRPIPAQTPVEKQQTISMSPAIRSFPAQTPVEKQQIMSVTPAIQPTSAQPPVEKQQIVSTTPAIRPVPAHTRVEKQQIISTTPAIQPPSAQPLVEKQQIISFPKPVLKYTYSRRGLKRPAPDPVPYPTLVEKQQMKNTVGPVLGQELSTSGGLNRPTLATTTTPAPVKKQKIGSTPDSVGGTMPTRAPVRARTPVRKQKIRTQDSVPRHTRPSDGGERSPVPVPARARTPVRKQQIISIQVPVLRHPQPSVGGERRSTTALARSPVRKQQTISTPDFDLRHTNPSVGGVRKPTAAPAPARARSPVRKPHTHPSAGGERRSSAAPARSPVRKEQIISTPDSVLRDTNPSVGGERQPTTAPAPARAGSPERKLHTHPSAGGERRSATALARSPVRKEQIISTPDSVLRDTNPSVGGKRQPTTALARARAGSPERKPHTHPSAGGERRSATALARSPVRKEQIISTPDSVLRDTNPSVGGKRQPTTARARAGSLERKPHTHPSAGGERRSVTALARSPVRKEQIISTPDSLLSHTNPSHRGLKSNNFDRHASRHMRVDSSVHRDSTASSGRNEGSMPQRMHVDHSLNKTTKDGRPEVLTLREALRADHVYHVRSGPKDVNMARVANFVNKRKIQEAAEHPALVNKPDRDAWTGPQIRSVIVTPPSLKKQKI